MTRLQIEKGIINCFEKLIKNEDINTISKYDAKKHSAEYGFSSNGFDYKFVLLFYKSNYIKLQCLFNVSSNIITDYYNNYTSEKKEKYNIVTGTINSYAHPENENGLYNTLSKLDFYIDKEPVNSEFDLEIIAKETIYDKIFKVIKENLVPRTNSLTKLDYLFNELPYLNNNEDKPSSTVFASLLINQVLTATLLAAVNDNKNKESIYEKYLSYASKFAKGDYPPIDVMRGIIKSNSIC